MDYAFCILQRRTTPGRPGTSPVPDLLVFPEIECRSRPRFFEGAVIHRSQWERLNTSMDKTDPPDRLFSAYRQGPLRGRGQLRADRTASGWTREGRGAGVGGHVGCRADKRLPKPVGSSSSWLPYSPVDRSSMDGGTPSQAHRSVDVWGQRPAQRDFTFKRKVVETHHRV